MKAVKVYGKNLKQIKNHVKTKTFAEIESHICLLRQKIISDQDLDGADLLEILDEPANNN